jgi:hypothetical protein
VATARAMSSSPSVELGKVGLALDLSRRFNTDARNMFFFFSHSPFSR